MGRDKLALCLGDVVGKGLPASLLMANLQATLRSQSLLSPSVRDTMATSNKLLYASTNAEKFVTLFYGILNHNRHRLVYSNGGHNPPLLFRSGDPPRPLDCGGLIMGFLEEAEYEEDEVALEAGDVLLLYSDGITEACDGGEKEFGVGPLSELVREHRRFSSDGITGKIFEAMDAHSGGDVPQDDQTIIVIKRTA